MAVPHPDKDPEYWDTVKIDGRRVPGAVSVECPVRREIDKKKPRGKDGASIKDLGYIPAEVTITVRIAGEERGYREFDAFQDFLRSIHPRKKGGARSKHSIQSAETELKEVSDIYVYEIGPTTKRDGNVMQWVIKACEWVEEPVEIKEPSFRGDPSKYGMPYDPQYSPFERFPYVPEGADAPGLPTREPDPNENL